MATDDTITRLNGDKITRTSLTNDSRVYYEEQYENNLTDVCDFSEGSEINTLHNSFAVELFSLYKELVNQAKQKYVRYATGVYLDELGCEYHLSRKQSEVATGTVTFTCSESVNSGYTIPAGTIILGRGTGYEYVLQNNVTIVSANTPVNGQVYSKLTGAKYNALPDTLTAFQDVASIRKPVKVTNPSAITNGVDAETDEEFRQRILAVKKEKAYGTVSNYSNFIVDTVSDVHDVQFVDPNLLITASDYPKHYKSNSNTECTDCSRVIFVNAESKPCPDNVIDEVEYLMTQENNIVIGQVFHIEKAKITPIYFSIHIYVTSLIDEDVLADYIEAFLNGDTVTTKTGEKSYVGLNINETLYKNKLIDVIEDIPGVSQVESIHRLRFSNGTYNKKLPSDINSWTSNGVTGYTYIDNDGYVYSRKNTDESSINYWGEKNFDAIPLKKGKVFSLGQKKDLDDTTEDVFSLTQTVIT